MPVPHVLQGLTSPRSAVAAKPGLTLILAGDSDARLAPNLCRGAAEVIEVGASPRTDLAASLDPGTGHRFVCSGAGPARRVNLGLSFAGGDWVVALFGDEALDADWLAHVHRAIAGRDADAHLFVARGAPPLVVLRRRALGAGAPDEQFSPQRLSLLHWAARILAPAGGKLVAHEAPWLSGEWPASERPFETAAELWTVLDPGGRAVLLGQALASPSRLLAEIAGLKKREEGRIGEPNVYRTGSYEPRAFWEHVTEGYVKWEVFQPDEPEIEEIVRRTRPASVLELGCGAGRNARYFEGAGTYAGIDLSLNLLDRAVERQGPNSAGLACGDVCALPFRDRSFDLVFADSTIQHVTPARVATCVSEAARVSSRHVCVIEFTNEERDGGDWFGQVHMFAHDYPALFAPFARLLWRAETSIRVQPAIKEVFLFETKRAA
ncbi:MAG: methyltransferase domain-containing protein [Alphaproteobacteria bacterium]